MPAERDDNPPLLDVRAWERALAGVNPAMLLLAIERRLGPKLAANTSADDVLQETLMVAWEDRAAFGGGGPQAFRNWLLTIADHRICGLTDHFGALKRGGALRQQPLADSRHQPRNLPHSATPSRVAWYREQADALRAALDALPEDTREIVRLRLIEQLTVETIAARLGAGPSLVRHRLRRGAESLRFNMAGVLGSREVSS